ncbi:MAG: methionine--tRNA ligase [Anaerolineales bacterium]|nr:methionine--tRNA ligase [Anaerolineae bacterium]PWB51964.1 MAG: methionine--tRNA ligase [Anaerolineales bacterium]
MTNNILIAIAWPYANSQIHVGNITGSHLPGDIVARYHRLKGNRVLMVSGTDSHGTPVTLRADAEGRPAEQVYQYFHNQFLELFQKAGISYDLFTSTHTENHFKVAQSMFLALDKNGFLYTESRPQWYSPQAKRFLPDRYVEGTCYICGFEGARSDQCDRCGSVLEPEKLLNPHYKLDGSTPELRETRHYFLDLSKLEPEVEQFLRQRQDYWRETVVGQSLGQIESEGLLPRPITRDLDWGIPVPVDGWEGKCLYVWFEAVIGYLSATIEWAKITAQPEAWRDWWTDLSAKAFYFIGKDNIFFHAAFWPAQLKGVGKEFVEIFTEDEGVPLNLPYDIPANQFMNLEGQKISGSRNWAIWGLDFLSRYDADALRYYLTINMPELRDSDWDWDEFIARNNGELVATWGNLVNRVLPFAYKHWDGVVPEPGELRPKDKEIIATIENGFTKVGSYLEAVSLRAALNEALRLAAEGNKYLADHKPWDEVKIDKAVAAKTIYTGLRIVDSLKVLFAPFIPFSSERLNTYLGYSQPLFGEQYIEPQADRLGIHNTLRYRPPQEAGHWQASNLRPGQRLNPPAALFKKLEPALAQEERAKLGEPIS